MPNTSNNGKSKLIEIKPNNTLISIKESNKIVLILIALSFNLLISIFVILLLLVNNNKLASKKTIFIQTNDGLVRKAVENNEFVRSDLVIKNFVKNWMYLFWEIDSSIPGSDLEDKGVSVTYDGKQFKVPSRAYAASFGIKKGFREEFLHQYSEFVPEGYYTSKFESKLIIYDISKPVKIGDKYQVQVIATRTDLQNDQETGRYQINKIITLQPIEPYQLAIGLDEKNEFRKYLQKFLVSGLIIDSISNIE